jgi:hypothetical protein
VSVRIEQADQNNATTWAMTIADLVNVVLSDYGNATDASFDPADISNMASMGGGGIGGTILATAATTTIVDTAAYQSAQYLTTISY